MGVQEQYRDYVMTGFVKRVEPVVADHGDGALLYDADGTEYIDCFAGISVTNAGHHNRKILDAAIAQAEKLVHACSYVYHVESVGALAEKLAEITPGDLQKTFFGNGGAEAIEGAFRLAKRYSGKNEFLAIESSFHGRSYATLSVTGNSGRKKGGGPYMPGVAFVVSLLLVVRNRNLGLTGDEACILFGVRATLAAMFPLAHLRWLKAALTQLEAEGALKS